MTSRDIAEIIAEQDFRAANIESFATSNDGRAFYAVPRRTSGLTSVIVSPSLQTRGGWRLTRFERQEPTGHVECGSYADAVKIAVADYGVLLDEVVFNNTK